MKWGIGGNFRAFSLGDAEVLGEVDAGVAAALVGDEAGGGEVDAVGGAEELDAHDGAGDGGVGSA